MLEPVAVRTFQDRCGRRGLACMPLSGRGGVRDARDVRVAAKAQNL